ncbi:hypothetical protein [Streptomyces sp. NPDC046821]
MIYGRFGYGVGSRKTSVEIDSTRVRIGAPAGTDDVRVRCG